MGVHVHALGAVHLHMKGRRMRILHQDRNATVARLVDVNGNLPSFIDCFFT